MDGSPYEILDIDFFDDREVALLLRHPPDAVSSTCKYLYLAKPRKTDWAFFAGVRHSLVTVAYQEIEMLPIEAGNLHVCLSDELPPIPLKRVHHFERSFEPLQFSLNGRAGRRIAAVLGGGGRVLEVLDMEEPEEEDEGLNTGQEDSIAE